MLTKLVALVATVVRVAKVVVAAAPTWLAVAAAALTYAATDIVPLLPGPWAVRAAGIIATLLVGVRAVLAAVERLTPVPPSLRGTTVDPAITQTSWQAPDGATMTYHRPGPGITTATNSTTVYDPIYDPPA